MPKTPEATAQRPQKGRDYRLETCFVGGNMKHRRIPLIAGRPAEEFLHAHADEAFLAAEGHFDLLYERECKRNEAAPAPTTEDDNGMIPF